MKARHFIPLLFTALVLILISCASVPAETYDPLGLFDVEETYWHDTNPPESAPSWRQVNSDGEYYCYYYTITRAPEEYADYIGTLVYYPYERGVANIWNNSCRESILLSLDYLQFVTTNVDDQYIICTTINLNRSPFCIYQEEFFTSDRDAIYYLLSHRYAGFKDMKQRGFTEELWDSATSYDELKDLLNTYVNDCHLAFASDHGFYYRKSQKYDEGAIRSTDPQKTCIIKETSNTYYIRYNSCDMFWGEYRKLPSLASKALNKEYIVLDFRSNLGGSTIQQDRFFKNLAKKNYKGKIFVLQDNWCYSAGEVWQIAGTYTKDLDLVLVGTHSGGMQLYGNVLTFKRKGVTGYIPISSYVTEIPSNYLGEGLGYEPHVWATTQTMKSVLQDLGLDLADIEFQ